jgi:hypothetical protein
MNLQVDFEGVAISKYSTLGRAFKTGWYNSNLRGFFGLREDFIEVVQRARLTSPLRKTI